jgi:hypothetical protein
LQDDPLDVAEEHDVLGRRNGAGREQGGSNQLGFGHIVLS